MHCDSPYFEYFPFGQDWQEKEPFLEENVPGEQGTQIDAPTPEYVPGKHCSHSELPDFENVPISQFEHLLDPGLSENCPAGHGIQNDDVVIE